MRLETVKLKEEGSLPDAHVVFYILDTPEEKLFVQKRPFVILCPGGGYERTSFREGEPIAMYFLGKGYHVAVLRYSTSPAVFPAALLELGRTMILIRENAEKWKVDAEQIFVQGCSAGGHLAGCLGTMWQEPFMGKKLGADPEMLRPAGLLLCYAVITSREGIAHEGSFRALLGGSYPEKKESLSLENAVTEYMPPSFLWHTFADATVPVENSLLMAQALHRSGVRTELHIFQEGAHGLGAADELSRRPDGSGVCAECQCWTELAFRWMENIRREDREQDNNTTGK